MNTSEDSYSSETSITTGPSGRRKKMKNDLTIAKDATKDIHSNPRKKTLPKPTAPDPFQKQHRQRLKEKVSGGESSKIKSETLNTKRRTRSALPTSETPKTEAMKLVETAIAASKASSNKSKKTLRGVKAVGKTEEKAIDTEILKQIRKTTSGITKEYRIPKRKGNDEGVGDKEGSKMKISPKKQQKISNTTSSSEHKTKQAIPPSIVNVSNRETDIKDNVASATKRKPGRTLTDADKMTKQFIVNSLRSSQQNNFLNKRIPEVNGGPCAEPFNTPQLTNSPQQRSSISPSTTVELNAADSTPLIPFVPEEMEFDGQASDNMLQESTNTSEFASFDLFDSMDVDIVEGIPTSTSDSSQKQIVLIPDTNVWIENMPLLQDILSTKGLQSTNTKGEADVVLNILIPWMVLQEIDYNIHKFKDTEKRKLFQNAAHHIHALLSRKDKRVRGQRAVEALIGIEFNELNADDSILNCVIQHSRIPKLVTVFMTNDVNLLNKALVHNLIALKPSNHFIQNLSKVILQSDGTAPELHTPALPTLLPNSQMSSVPTCPVEPVSEMDTDDPMEEVAPESINLPQQTHSASPELPSFDSVINELRKSLTQIIIPKMVDEYGEDWKFAIKIKPPFTVQSALKCLSLHWIAVFSYIFPPRAKEILDEMLDSFQNNKPDPSKSDSIQMWRLNLCRLAHILLTMNNQLAQKSHISETIKLLTNYISNETY